MPTGTETETETGDAIRFQIRENLGMVVDVGSWGEKIAHKTSASR